MNRTELFLRHIHNRNYITNIPKGCSSDFQCTFSVATPIIKTKTIAEKKLTSDLDFLTNQDLNQLCEVALHHLDQWFTPESSFPYLLYVC